MIVWSQKASQRRPATALSKRAGPCSTLGQRAFPVCMKGQKVSTPLTRVEEPSGLTTHLWSTHGHLPLSIWPCFIFGCAVAQYGGYKVTIMYCALWKAGRKDFESFYPVEIINVWGDKYVLPDLNITQCIHGSKSNMVPYPYAQFLCFYLPVKIDFKTF